MSITPAADRPVENSELRNALTGLDPWLLHETGCGAGAGDESKCDCGIRSALSRIEELFATLQQKPERWFPLQDGPRIPWSVAEKAYEDYARRYGRSQTLERLAERGGFGVGEMDDHHPKWRDEVEEIPKLRAEISRLRADQLTPSEADWVTDYLFHDDECPIFGPCDCVYPTIRAKLSRISGLGSQ